MARVQVISVWKSLKRDTGWQGLKIMIPRVSSKNGQGKEPAPRESQRDIEFLAPPPACPPPRAPPSAVSIGGTLVRKNKRGGPPAQRVCPRKESAWAPVRGRMGGASFVPSTHSRGSTPHDIVFFCGWPLQLMVRAAWTWFLSRALIS